MRETVKVFEVGLRDGLQNESRYLSLSNKVWLAQQLVDVGLKDLELGAFVRPDRVPQMADSDLLFECIQSKKLKLRTAQAWCLIPNLIGLERALAVGVTHFAIFTAATQSFAQSNIGMSIQESFREFTTVIAEARRRLGSRLKVRGYVSTAFGCPFEGKVPARKALRVLERMATMGVDQISIGDTIGVADPKLVETLIRPALKELKGVEIAVHFHDTRGTALANALRALDLGVRVIDSSIGGLGGCPFAPGAAGNLSTEDLVYMLNGMGMHTGVRLDALCNISLKLAQKMKRPLTSRYLQAFAQR